MNTGSLYTAQGARKYLTRDERQRVLAALAVRESDADLLALTLAWTGARVSEVLALTPQAFQLDTHIIAIRTLKRRRMVIREVPVPMELMAVLDQRFGLATAQRDPHAKIIRIWTCNRTTALAAHQDGDEGVRHLRAACVPTRPTPRLRRRDATSGRATHLGEALARPRAIGDDGDLR